MISWEPDLYRRFEAERTQPVRDLIARIPSKAPGQKAFGQKPFGQIVDLGCGPGNSTEALAQRYPEAELLGIDSSEPMLASARKRLPEARFEAHDIAAWRPGALPDLIFANAALQWVPDHAGLLPRLLGLLSPGGALAVQMPDAHDEPSHALMRQIASEPEWVGELGDVAARRAPVGSASDYYDLLAPRCARLEIWRTTYFHPMASAEAIADWMRGTGFRVYLERIDPDRRPALIARYVEALARAYPAQADGRLLLAFPRLFFVAIR